MFISMNNNYKLIIGVEVEKLIIVKGSVDTTESKFEEKLIEECPICKDNLYDEPYETTRCRHMFHKSCLDRWRESVSILKLKFC